MTEPDDTALITRLRDLALVEVDSLLAGVDLESDQVLLEAHADELEHALGEARARIGELIRSLGTNDPLVALDANAATRAKDGGRDGAERVARRLAARATAARALARLDDVVAAVYPRLVEADRRRAGG